MGNQRGIERITTRTELYFVASGAWPAGHDPEGIGQDHLRIGHRPGVRREQQRTYESMPMRPIGPVGCSRKTGDPRPGALKLLGPIGAKGVG